MGALVYLSRGDLMLEWTLPRGPPRSSASIILSFNDLVGVVSDALGSTPAGVAGVLLLGVAPGVEVIGASRMAASMSIWDWLIDPFGDGETGKTSMDSSKKVGRGTGCRVIPGSEWRVVVPVIVTVFCTAVILAFGAFWSLGEASPGWASLLLLLLLAGEVYS